MSQLLSLSRTHGDLQAEESPGQHTPQSNSRKLEGERERPGRQQETPLPACGGTAGRPGVARRSRSTRARGGDRPAVPARWPRQPRSPALSFQHVPSMCLLSGSKACAFPTRKLRTVSPSVAPPTPRAGRGFPERRRRREGPHASEADADVPGRQFLAASSSEGSATLNKKTVFCGTGGLPEGDPRWSLSPGRRGDSIYAPGAPHWPAWPHPVGHPGQAQQLPGGRAPAGQAIVTRSPAWTEGQPVASLRLVPTLPSTQ